MKLINVDVRHMLAEERSQRLNHHAKKFAILVACLSVATMGASLMVQRFCELVPYCM